MSIMALLTPLRALSVGLRPPLRTFSTAPKVSQDATPDDSQPRGGIEKLTIELLQDTMLREKTRPATDTVQRYQKIHRVGDIYHPEDLNDIRHQEQFRRRAKNQVPAEDPFNMLDLNPLHEYKNFRLLSHFVTSMGKILPREQTGLTAKNQRKLAKAIRRARAMGLMSCTTKDIGDGTKSRL